MKKYSFRVALFFSLLATLSCSWLQPREVSDLEKVAIIGVTGQYLEAALRVNEGQLDNLILWKDFLEDRGEVLTKAKVFAEMRTLKTRWPKESHPLIHMDLVSLNVSGETAHVVLRRKKPLLPEVSFELIWVGNAWLVSHDSIFGKDGLLKQEQPATTG